MKVESMLSSSRYQYPLSASGEIVFVAASWSWKAYITESPGNGTLLRDSTGLIGLTFDAQIHNMVSADSAVLY